MYLLDGGVVLVTNMFYLKHILLWMDFCIIVYISVQQLYYNLMHCKKKISEKNTLIFHHYFN